MPIKTSCKLSKLTIVEYYKAVKAGLCFYCLELCPCFHLIEPSGYRHVAVAVASLLRRCCVAVASLLRCYCVTVAVDQVARTTPIKTLF